MTLRTFLNSVKEEQNVLIKADWSAAGFYRYGTVSDIAYIFLGREVLSVSAKNDELIIEVN